MIKDYYLVIDVGATKTRIAVARGDGTLVEKHVWRTPIRGKEVTQRIVEKAQALAEKYDVVGVGVGTIGPIDVSQGRVISAPNGPREGFELGRPLREALRKPVYVVNDCVAAVWGELHYGVARGYENIVYLTLSTGIGAGIIVDGHLLLGKRGNAHEVGHIVVDFERRMQCGCGGWGHWEAYSGGANIPRFASKILEDMKSSSGLKETETYRAYREGRLTTPLIYKLALQGDPLAKHIVNEVNKINKAGIESIVNMYDPEIIIIGGTIALQNPELTYKPLKQYIDSAIGVVAGAKPKIVLTTFGDDVVLVGALAVASRPPENLTRKIEYNY